MIIYYDTKGMKEMYFDSHAHIDDEKYDSDREAVIEEIIKIIDF